MPSSVRTVPRGAGPPAPAALDDADPRGRRRALALTIGLLLSLVAHLLVLYLPGESVPAAGFEAPGLDKAIHVVIFAAPALLTCLVTGRVWPVTMLLVHAPVSEVLQSALAEGRSADPWDAVAGVAGVALGVLAARRIRRSAGAFGGRLGQRV